MKQFKLRKNILVCIKHYRAEVRISQPGMSTQLHSILQCSGQNFCNWLQRLRLVYRFHYIMNYSRLKSEGFQSWCCLVLVRFVGVLGFLQLHLNINSVLKAADMKTHKNFNIATSQRIVQLMFCLKSGECLLKVKAQSQGG